MSRPRLPGAEQDHAVVAGDADEILGAAGAGGAEHDGAGDAPAPGRSQRPGGLIGGAGDHEQVDGPGKIGDGAMGGDTTDRQTRVVHRVDPSAESVFAQGAHHLVSGVAVTLHGAHDRYRPGREQWPRRPLPDAASVQVEELIVRVLARRCRQGRHLALRRPSFQPRTTVAEGKGPWTLPPVPASGARWRALARRE
nr:hypothetical protein [Actinoplanes atraurantiacus]